jgi:hypothetical protein
MTGDEVSIEPMDWERRCDVPTYLYDCSHLFKRTGWGRSPDARAVLVNIHAWRVANESTLTHAPRIATQAESS